MKALRSQEVAAFFGVCLLWTGNRLVIRIGAASRPPWRFAGRRITIFYAAVPLEPDPARRPLST